MPSISSLLSLLPPLLASLPQVGPGPRTVWLPEQASTIAPQIDLIFDLINYLCYFFFILITVLLVWFVIKYRRSPDNHGGNAGGPTHNTVLELSWTIIPIILVVFIFGGGFRSYIDLVVAPKNAYEVEVTASQWSFNFKYPNGANSDVLVVPAGQPVRVVMRSVDVIHAFFVPDFRVKRDIVPGRTTATWFEAPFPTDDDPENLKPENGHHLFCAEYCGTDHSKMITRVHVLERPLFDVWLEKQSRWIDEIELDALWAVAGPKLFARCVQCHSLDGTDGNGPSWSARAGLGSIWERTAALTTKFADGRTLADFVGPGKKYATPEDYLQESILNPGANLVQGFGNAMPTFKGQINEKGIAALIGMMKRIDQFDAKGQPKPGTEAARLADAHRNRKQAAPMQGAAAPAVN